MTVIEAVPIAARPEVSAVDCRGLPVVDVTGRDRGWVVDGSWTDVGTLSLQLHLDGEAPARVVVVPTWRADRRALVHVTIWRLDW